MTSNLRICVGRATLALLGGLCLLEASSACQDSGDQGTNSFGSSAEIEITVRDRSRQVITVPTIVKLYKNGALQDQRSTSQGHAFFILRGLGEFTVAVEAAGYKAAQREVSIPAAMQYQEDVYLEWDTTSGNGTGAPGRAVLAPKARKALEKGAQALTAGKLEEAQKFIGEAIKLAPANPDVLYLQGMLYMEQSNWEQAQTTLEQASRMDPNQPRLLAALGMNLVHQKKFAEAIPLLEKSIQLHPASGWGPKWALGKAYYYHEQYEQALSMAEQAHTDSHGSSAQAELLLAQCLTVVGRYEDSAQVLREFLKNNTEGPDAQTARSWLERLTTNGKIRP
jgi:tetratricopeptide (TPR) repeat protein